MRVFKDSKPMLTENGKVNADTRKRVKASANKLLLEGIKGLNAVEEGAKYELPYKNADGQIVYLHIEVKVTEMAYADSKAKK